MFYFLLAKTVNLIALKNLIASNSMNNTNSQGLLSKVILSIILNLMILQDVPFVIAIMKKWEHSNLDINGIASFATKLKFNS